jgi:hypothetical protein
VTTDPALLINGALPQNCIALCLQFCPLRETLYVCAGSKTQIVAPVAAPTGKPPAKGAVVEVVAEAVSTELNDNLWVVDKVVCVHLNLVVFELTCCHCSSSCQNPIAARCT